MEPDLQACLAWLSTPTRVSLELGSRPLLSESVLHLEALSTVSLPASGPEGPHRVGLPVASFSLTCTTPSTCYPTQPLARCVAGGGGWGFFSTFPFPCVQCLPVLLAAFHLLPMLFLWLRTQIVLSWSQCSDFSVLILCIYLFLNMQTYAFSFNETPAEKTFRPPKYCPVLFCSIDRKRGVGHWAGGVPAAHGALQR